MGPFLVVDIQPAFAHAFTDKLVEEVLATMRAVPDGEPIVVLSVNEECSGDTPESVLDFWVEKGMDEALRERVTFLEKDFGFFRGWMGNTDDFEIVNVARALRSRRVWDSRELPEELLEELAPTAYLGVDCLFLPHELESSPILRQHAWEVCGGGRNECLKEVELWMTSANISHQRIDHLTY